MSKKKLPRSIRKHIRKEKARIRREVLGLKKQEEEISRLYQKFLGNNQLKKSSKKEASLKISNNKH